MWILCDKIADKMAEAQGDAAKVNEFANINGAGIANYATMEQLRALNAAASNQNGMAGMGVGMGLGAGLGAGMGFGGMNMMQMLMQLKSNPLGILRQAGFNVPYSMNNPQEISQYLMNSGQVSQEQLNRAQQQAQMFGNMK